MQEKRLIKKTGLYLIGNLSSRFMSALVLPIYAFYIKTNDLGYYDYTQTMMGILVPIVFIAIWEAILRFLLFETDKTKQQKIIATSAGFTICMAGIFALGIITFGSVVAPQTASLFLIGIMFIAYAIAQIWQYFARALGENKLYVFSGILGTIVNFLCILVLICALKYKLEALFIAYILGQFSIFGLIEIKIHILKNIKMRHFDAGLLKEMLLFSAPLVLNLTSAWLFSGFGRMLITNKLGTEMNGLFSFASKFSIIVTMLGSVVTMAIIEEAIITLKTKGFNSEFTKTLEFVFKIFMTLSLLAVPAIGIFYKLIQNTDYYASLGYAPWLVMYAVLTTMTSNIGAIFLAIDKTKHQFITTAIGAALTVYVSYSLISFINVYAVIIGQIVGALAMLLSRYYIVNKYVYLKIDWKPILGMAGVFLCVVVICLTATLLVNSLIFILTITIVCLLNSKYLISYYNSFKQKLKV